MDRSDFQNEPLTDFSLDVNRSAMEAALGHVANQLGADYPVSIGGERAFGSSAGTLSQNPTDPGHAIGRVPDATAEHADRAIRMATGAFERWRRATPTARSGVLFRAAETLRRRKHDFSAWMIHEVGKTWAEADADTAEAIDFLEFYGRESLRYSGDQPLSPVAGERNRLLYLPLGAGVVIPPWNFPLAILTGMTAAAIAAGNTVVLKPSSDSPIIAAQMVSLLESAGLPPGVRNFVTGQGSVVGEALITHPLTRFIAFTGSKEVGLRINELAARPQPGQHWIKRVIAEMGGKNAIIVDRSADLQAAVEGIVASAYGFSGQKCSACSRAIVDASLYDAFLTRLKARTETLVVGDPRERATDVGPVINERGMNKILEYIEIGKTEGRLLTGGGRLDGAKGYIVRPTVFADVSPKARIAQEEIFGPVLAVIKAADIDEALHIANDTEFGLTGSIYSQDPLVIDKASREFFVGNLYVNRKSTGALVGGHPFGGFKMSGTNSKAGGRDYLMLFLQAQAISERITAPPPGEQTAEDATQRL
jgi:1-pyrroline-5-carboxylate dehydrogenase